MLSGREGRAGDGKDHAVVSEDVEGIFSQRIGDENVLG